MFLTTDVVENLNAFTMDRRGETTRIRLLRNPGSSPSDVFYVPIVKCLLPASQFLRDNHHCTTGKSLLTFCKKLK